MKILHIIQHLSRGGAARAMMAVAKHSSRLGTYATAADGKAYQHSVMSLDPPESEAVAIATDAGMRIVEPRSKAEMWRELESADIVHFHFWNHPKNYALLRSPLPPMRLLLWFHVAGDKPPQIITPEAIALADFALACSPYTYECAAFQNLPLEVKRQKTGMVYAPADFDRFSSNSPLSKGGGGGFSAVRARDRFNVGYIGTIDFVKMHPNYVPMSAKINIPGVRFVVCGDGIIQELQQQAEKLGAGDRFEFRGVVEDIKSVLEILDVYGYPLCEDTYAAAELNLQEVMYAGVPPVVFPYGGVKRLVINNETGLIVNSELEYQEAIEYLYHHPEERARLGRNARKYALENFGGENAARELNLIYEKMMAMPKRERLGEAQKSGVELFVKSLGNAAAPFVVSMTSNNLNELWEADRKIALSSPLLSRGAGGILPYKDSYPKDAYLRFWCGLFLQEGGENAEAMSQFQEAIALGCNHWRVNWYLAKLAAKLNKIELAKKMVGEVTKKAPEFEEAKEMLQGLSTREEVAIVTSIAPGKTAIQQAAIKSWLDLGFSVVSLNNLEEVTQLKPLYKNVTFYPVKRDAKAEVGRALVYFDDIFLYLKERGTKICGIVNSDIRLKAGDNFCSFISQQAENATIICSRMDVDADEDTSGKIYPKGFDAFFFDKKFVELFPKSQLCLGLPWWDLWLPGIGIKNGWNLKYLTTPVAYHLKHEINYYNDFWQKTGVHFLAFFQPELSRKFEGMLASNKDRLQVELSKIGLDLVPTILEKSSRISYKKVTGKVKVSAIVSTYNSENFLGGCLEDLVKQTLYKKGELEIIIIDSASEEKEGAIASQFQSKYANIIYHRTAERETIYGAWNRGIKLATGEYITNANTDDRHRPDALETLANYLDQNPETSLVYGDQLITAIPNETWETTKANKRWNWPEFNYNELEKRCIIGPQPMWRKSLHENHGYFREEFSVAGDYEFWLRIGKSEKIVRLPEILGLYYENKQGLEKASPAATQETHKVWQEYGTLQRGVVPKASVPTSISESELNALPYRQSQPLVSVIIPCFNYAKYLPEAVASVVNQTYQNWECIIVNDGSSDNTSEVAKHLIKLYGDKQIRLLEKSNSGVAETRNVGISQSAGTYILCLDADDKIHPSFIEETAAVLAEKNQIGFVYTDFEHFGSRSEVVTKGDFDLQKFLRSNQAPVTSLFKREIFEQTGGFKTAMAFGWEDWEFWVAACELGWVGHRLPKPYLLYRVHPAGSRQQQIHSSNLMQAVHFALIINLHSRLYTPKEVQWSEEILRQHGSLINWGAASQLPLKKEQTSQQTKSSAKIEYPSIQPVGENVRRPLFSVMLPTYNPNPVYLEQTLNSVLQQDLGVEEMQIEVVDDCSTAVDVGEIVNKVGKGRISFCRQEQNLGQIANWNDCIRRARGEWVHILHQDDLVLPGFYRRLAIDPPPAPLEKGGAFPSYSAQIAPAAAFCRYYYIDEAGNQRFLSPLERETAGVIDKFLERIAIQQRIQFATVIVKRSVYEKLGGFCPQAESAADWEMWKRIAAFYPIWFEPEIFACFRLHSSSETSRLMRSGENIANARKAIEISQSYLPKTMAEELSNKAKEHYAMEALKMAASMLTKDDANGAIAQMREGLKCSQSPQVINLLVSVLVSTKTEGGQRSEVRGQRLEVNPIPHSQFPKVIIDGVMFQIYESGITRVWRSLLTEWAKQGFGDKIIVLDRNHTAPQIAGLHYREVPAYDYNKTEADRQILQHICDAEKADIFISTYYTTPIYTPSLFVAYDMIPELMGANINNPMWKEKHFAINYASGYVAISQNTAKDFVKFFPNINADSVTVAYCGVGKNFSPVDGVKLEKFKNKYGLKKPYFLWVGDRVGFNGYKNARLFFQACANYPHKKQLEIVCVGGALTLEPKLQGYVEGIEVKMLRLGDEELRAAYSGALALVQTSKYEGFGLPILEAIACGCPVITHAHSSIPEVAGNAAFYIGDSVEELVKAMLEIQKLEVRQPLIAAGLERAKKFSWGAMANAVSSVLIETVNGELGSPPAPLEKGGDFSPSAALEKGGDLSPSDPLGKQVGETVINPLPSLGEIKKAIENYREKQTDKSALIELQEIRKQIAEIWLSLGKLEELRNAYSGEVGQAHKALLESGIKDESLIQIEQILVGQIKANIAKGFKEPVAIKYLLAGMLYQGAALLGVKYEKAPIPSWFATDYLRFMFAAPQMFQEIGEADNYYRFLEGWLSYVRENISANPNSELWRAIAWLFVQNSNWIPLYFTNTPNLKSLYLKRAEIVEFALKNRGLQLDYPIGERPPNRQKIRLGILKDHYTPQTETYSLLPAFEHLDRSKFEVILYAVKSNGHPLEQYCQNRADKFLRLPDDLESQAQTIRGDDLDILFVGSNVTAGMKNSTLLAMHRLARVQVTSINSPTTTGMRNMDYYIGGSLTAPVEAFSEHYTEKLLNLEGSGLCFRYAIAASPPAVQPVRSSWGATEKTTIFISGANFYKVVPELRETWAKILAAVPDSILVLYPFNPNWTSSYPAAPFVQQMRSVLERHGIDRKRLVVIKALPSKSDIEQCLQLADVYLDSFPYGGATSLVDPLTVGVPPVVVEGNALRFRQASAMLREIGMEELIADSEESYINLAVKLATNSQWRQQKREEIKAKMLENPPFLDSRGYSAKMGALLEGLLSAEIPPPPPLKRGEPEDVADEVDEGKTGILPVPEVEVQAALSSEFLNRIMGCVNLYEIDPDDESLVGELRQLRLELAAFWMSAAPEQLETLYGGEMRQAYRALLACGIQSEALTGDEEGFLQHLTEVSTGLSQPKAVNALLGAMLYFPPGKMRVRDAASRLPHWLIEDYQEVFENLPQLSEDPPRPPLERGEEEGNPLESQEKDGDPPRPPLERGEEEGNSSLERGEEEEEAASFPRGEEEVPELKFVNEVVGSVHLYYIEPSDESVVDRLRQLRRQMADLCLQLPAEELEGFYRGEVGKGFKALLGCGFQNEPMQEDEVAFVQEVAIALAKGVEAPKALNHLLAAMLYCRRGQLQVEDTGKLPQWLLEDYEKFAAGESPLVVAG